MEPTREEGCKAGMESTSAASERTAIVRVKRKATDSAADTLMVEGLPGPKSKRAASASLVQQLQQLSCSVAATPLAKQTPQRFQLFGTLPSGLHETLAARTLQAMMESRPSAAAPEAAGPGREAAGPGREAPGLQSSMVVQASALTVYDTGRPPKQRVLLEAPDSAQPPMAEGDRESFVYDYYRAVEPGAGEPPGSDGNDFVPTVQVLMPEGELAYMEEEVASGTDSEDSNAENHYTHEYPDDDDEWRSSTGSERSPKSTSDVYDDD